MIYWTGTIFVDMLYYFLIIAACWLLSACFNQDIFLLYAIFFQFHIFSSNPISFAAIATSLFGMLSFNHCLTFHAANTAKFSSLSTSFHVVAGFVPAIVIFTLTQLITASDLYFNFYYSCIFSFLFPSFSILYVYLSLYMNLYSQNFTILVCNSNLNLY